MPRNPITRMLEAGWADDEPVPTKGNESMPDKKSLAELKALAKDCPRFLEHFVHYKTGNRYIVTGWAIVEATQDVLVLYQTALDSVTFARPLREWRELVQHEGKAVERFRAVEM